MKIHELKIWGYHFACVRNSSKKFEVRKNDRNFQEDDVLHLREWDEQEDKYTGRSCLVKVGNVLKGGQFGIDEGYCVMSIELLKTQLFT